MNELLMNISQIAGLVTAVLLGIAAAWKALAPTRMEQVTARVNVKKKTDEMQAIKTNGITLSGHELMTRLDGIDLQLTHQNTRFERIEHQVDEITRLLLRMKS